MRRVRPVLACVAFLVAATIVSLHTVAKMNVPGDPQLLRSGMADFRDAIYYPVVALLDGNNPYDVARYRATYPVINRFPLYSPVTLLLHLPFGLLSQRHAQSVYLGINLLLFLVLARVALRAAALDAAAGQVLALAALLLISQPGQRAVFVGQSSVYLAIGVYLALHFARSRPWLAAAGLAVACGKPTFGVPVAFLMLWRGDWRAVMRGAGAAALCSAAVGVALVHAAGGVWPFLASLRDNYATWGLNHSTSVAESVHRVDAYLLFSRVLGRPLGSAEDVALTVLIFALAAWTVRRLTRSDGERSRELTAAVICLATLSGTYHQVYDALILTFPALAIAGRRWERIGGAPGRNARRGLLAMIAVPMTNYLASFPVAGSLDMRGMSWLAITTSSAAAIFVCFALLIAVGLRRSLQPALAAQPRATDPRVPVRGLRGLDRAPNAGAAGVVLREKERGLPLG